MQIDEINTKRVHEKNFKKLCMPILNIINIDNEDIISTNLIIAAMITALGVIFM